MKNNKPKKHDYKVGDYLQDRKSLRKNKWKYNPNFCHYRVVKILSMGSVIMAIIWPKGHEHKARGSNEMFSMYPKEHYKKIKNPNQ